MKSRTLVIVMALFLFSSSMARGDTIWPVGMYGGISMPVNSSGDALATYNLTNNSFIITSVKYSLNGTGTTYTGNAQNFQQWLYDACDYGMWDGVGISSSTAKSDSLQITGFSWCTGQEYLDRIGTTFHNETVTAGEIIGSYGYYGDMNFDGKVDQSDINLFNSIYNSFAGSDIYGLNRALGTNYVALGSILGDFNYDGYVDGADRELINAVYARGGKPYGILNQAYQTVPEPSVFVLLCMGAIVLLRNAVNAVAGKTKVRG